MTSADEFRAALSWDFVHDGMMVGARMWNASHNYACATPDTERDRWQALLDAAAKLHAVLGPWADLDFTPADLGHCFGGMFDPDLFATAVALAKTTPGSVECAAAERHLKATIRTVFCYLSQL